MHYNDLNIYKASFDEIKDAVKEQYKNREISDYQNRTLTVGDWKSINSEIRNDLKRMGVKCKGAFYNPNNMRVYIKQTFRTVKYNGFNYRMNSSEDYFTATGEDYYTDAEFFSVPAW